MGVKWGRTAQRQVSLLQGKSEEARCYRETFESWLQSWKLPKILEAVKTHRPRRVSPLQRRMRKARCYGRTFESWVERWQLSLTFLR